MLADQIEDPLRRTTRECHHANPEGGPEIALDDVRLALQAGVDLPAITARRSPSWLAGFEHGDIDAALREMQRRR